MNIFVFIRLNAQEKMNPKIIPSVANANPLEGAKKLTFELRDGD